MILHKGPLYYSVFFNHNIVRQLYVVMGNKIYRDGGTRSDVSVLDLYKPFSVHIVLRTLFIYGGPPVQTLE